MNDLVERLRGEASLLDAHTASWVVHLPSMLREAADALERAQKALRRIADNYEDGGTLSGTQCAEIAREALDESP